MFIVEKYEFAHAVRIGGRAGVLEIWASEVDIHEDGDWIIFVCADGRSTKVPVSNIVGILGQWVKLDTQTPPDQMTLKINKKPGKK
jgi:hypothetical protein